MKEDQEPERAIELLLRSVPVKQATPGLRERVLRAARAKREATAWTTPLLRIGLAGGATLLVIAIAMDAFVAHGQAHRLQTLLRENRPLQTDAERDWAGLAADLGGFVDRSQLALIRAQAAGPKEIPDRLDGVLHPEHEKEVF